jgi:hypothetical protein
VEFTREKLKEKLIYYPDTGRFAWKTSSKGTSTEDTVGNITLRGSRAYRQITIFGVRTYAHCWAYFYMNGVWPKLPMDHIDGNGLNNSWKNLREVTPQTNCRNKAKPRANKSGVVGVYTRGDSFIANICVDRKTKYLGIFGTMFEAVCARKAAELQYGFHENHGRSL